MLFFSVILAIPSISHMEGTKRLTNKCSASSDRSEVNRDKELEESRTFQIREMKEKIKNQIPPGICLAEVVRHPDADASI